MSAAPQRVAQVTRAPIAAVSAAGTFRVVQTTTSLPAAPAASLAPGRRPPTRVFAPGQFRPSYEGNPLAERLARPAKPLAVQHRGLASGQPLVDANSRVRVAKVVDCLGWAAGQKLAARIAGPRVTVTPASDAPSSALVSLALDKGMRLTLSPAICFALGLTPGAQVQAIADPATGALTLFSLSEALNTLLKDAS